MRRWAGLALLAALVASGAPALAQTLRSAGPVHIGPTVALPAAPGARYGLGTVGAVREGACAPSDRTARFEVTYEGFSPAAQRAFQAALDTWACYVASDRPIRVLAKWEALGASTLGSAGPTLYRDFPGAPARGTWYAAALADHLAGDDLGGDQPDIEALFNSTFGSWHLDPTTWAPQDRYDLFTVVLHEIGHGLGLIGALRVEDRRGFVGGGDGPEGPYVYDRFVEAADGTPLLNEARFPDGSAALADALQSRTLFDGRGARRAFGQPVPLYAPARWLDGGSHSHLDEALFSRGEPDGLLTPFIGRGEAHDGPGPVICGMLLDIGWTMGPSCRALLGDLSPLTEGLTVERRGPNPFRLRTQLAVRPAVPQRLRADLVDATGRRVAALFDGDVGAGEALVLTVDGAGLAPGVYFVQLEGEGGRQSVAVTHLR